MRIKNFSLQARRTAGQSQRSRRGAAMVEMAIVLPVFITILLGTIEFGRALMVSQLITNAAREAARLAVVEGTTTSQVRDSAKSFMYQAGKVSPNDVTVTVTTPNGAGGEVANCVTRDLITVKVEVPFVKVSYLPPSFLQSINLSGTSSMRHE